MQRQCLPQWYMVFAVGCMVPVYAAGQGCMAHGPEEMDCRQNVAAGYSLSDVAWDEG